MRDLSGKNVLVTGAAGFIGSHLADRLADMPLNRLVVLDNLYLGKKSNLVKARAKRPDMVEYLAPEYSTADYSAMEKVFSREQIDVVFDLATIPLPASLEDPKWCFEEITAMAVGLSELCRQGAFKSFIHCSTSEVYGTARFVPMDESHPWDSRTSYAAAKGGADLCIRSYVTTYGIEAVIVRPFNTYGPRQNKGNYAGVIPIFCNQLLNGENSVIYGDGEQSRDFTYVSDIAEAFVRLAQSNFVSGEIINLAAGNEITINELGRLIYNARGKRFRPEYAEERPGDVRRHAAGIDRLRELTGFVAQVEMDEGLKRTLDWYDFSQAEGE